MEYKILRIGDSRIETLIPLAVDSMAEGHEFVNRTVHDFLSGENCFDKNGEVLYGAFRGRWCLGICGLNEDPYTDEPGIGRVRHLYVLRQFRKRGVGEALIKKIVEKAGENFRILRLKSTPEAYGFYDRMGFHRNAEEHESHRLELGKAEE